MHQHCDRHPSPLPTCGSFFHEDLVMKLYQLPFFHRRASCKLLAKECRLSTGKLPLGGLPKNSVVRITGRLDMTSAGYYRVSKKNDNTFNQSVFIFMLQPQLVCI